MGESSKRDNRLAFLGPLKGILAIIIVMHHYIAQIPGEHHGVLKLFDYIGYLPVEFYFFISGLLFVVAYYKKINQGEYSLGVFFKKRIVKLYPEYFITLIIVSILYVLCNKYLGTAYYINLRCFVYNIFMLQGGLVHKLGSYTCPINGVTWFLTPLLVCSIVAYLISKFKEKDYTIMFSGFLCIAAVVMIDFEVIYPFFNASMSRGFAGFFLGMCAGFMLDGIIAFSKRTSSLIIAIIGLGLFVYNVYLQNMSSRELIVVTELLVIPTTFIILWHFDIIGKLLCNKVFEFLGNISYSLFLWHFPVLMTIFFVKGHYGVNIDFGRPLVFVGFMAVVLLLSWFSNKFIRFRKVK